VYRKLALPVILPLCVDVYPKRLLFCLVDASKIADFSAVFLAEALSLLIIRAAPFPLKSLCGLGC